MEFTKYEMKQVSRPIERQTPNYTLVNDLSHTHRLLYYTQKVIVFEIDGLID